jgi:hypothetical protein
MMNQKVGIYIILSAVLLYLYYRRNDLAIFAAFVAVVGGTLIFRDQNQNDDREGFGFGGGGGGGGKLDKECAKMGFKPIKLDKDDLAGTLEHVIKNIEKVAAKHWPYDGMGGNQDSTTEKDEEKKKRNAEFESFLEVWKKEAKEDGDNKKKSDQSTMFFNASVNIYEKKRYNELVAEKPENIKKIISGGELTLKILEKVSKSDELDSGFKKTLKYLICLCKYWISIYKEVQKANDGGGDEEEKPKKKKKKASEDDEGGGDDEEEKPKKKKKKKASEDDDE